MRNVSSQNGGVYATSSIWEAGETPDESYSERLDRLGVPRTPEVLRAVLELDGTGIELGADDRLRLIGIIANAAASSPVEPIPWKPMTPVKGRPSCVYFIRHGEHVKIGTTAQTAKQRLAGMQLPPGAELVAVIPDSGYEREKSLHRRFKASRVHGEWFTSTPELESLISTFAV